MPTMPSDYYNNFNATKNYDTLLYRDGYTLQGQELNEAQSAAAHRLKGVADALFKDGDLIRDAGIMVNPVTGEVQAQSGAVYLQGAVRGVPEATFTIPTTGTVAIGVRLVEKVISELDDPALYNSVIGSRGEGEPGAWRLQINPVWGFDADGKEGEFYPVYTVDNGEVRAKEAPPTLDSFTQGIARYDRDSTAGGSYVVSGLQVLLAENDTSGNQMYTVSEGRARVNGYGVDLPTSRRLTYAAVPDLRTIDTEVHIATAASTQAGGQRLTVAHAPVHAVTAVRLTTRKTVSLVHGAYSGVADVLPNTAVVTLVECRQGNTVFVQGADYKKTGDTVDWSPSGNEPATGSTYSCVFDCVITGTAIALDADGFSVEGAVAGSSILISYSQALPRLDRLALTQDGQFQWIAGVASERNARTPSVPPQLLSIATVRQTWRKGSGENGGRSVLSDGVRVVPFSEIEIINRRIEAVQQEVARQRLEADVFTRESGARAGIFVDPLLNDDMRDQGLAQSAAVVNGELTLPIAAQVAALSADISTPLAMPWTPVVRLSQPLRTGSMKVNPYMAFEPLPARASLTPAVDRWTETRTDWTSPVTNRFETWIYAPNDPRHGQGLESSSSSTQNLGQRTTNLEYLRPINVSYRVEGFGGGEQLDTILFDGVVLYSAAKNGGQPRSASTAIAAPIASEGESPTGRGGERNGFDGVKFNISGTADSNGVLAGSFTIPAGIPAGAKTVAFTGRAGSRGSAVFVGQGQLTVTTLRQVNTVNTVWVDPLAQTFVLETDTQLAGVDVYFTAAGGDARLQIREVDNGVPTRTVLAEAFIPRASMVVTGGGHTRVLLSTPLSVAANTEYAVVILCDDAVTALSVAELGKLDPTRQTWVTSQPYQVGVLLSSSNASTWTAHQDKDMTFRLLEASFTAPILNQELGAASVVNATDLLLLALSETPTSTTRVEYDVTLPPQAGREAETLTVADGQPVRLAQPATGEVRVRARLAGTSTASPLLWPGTQLVSGSVAESADYFTRSIPATGATKAVLVYDAVIPSGASVTARLKKDDGSWVALSADGTTNQGDGLVEYRWKSTLANVNDVKIKITLTGTNTARPRVKNIRFMAVL